MQVAKTTRQLIRTAGRSKTGHKGNHVTLSGASVMMTGACMARISTTDTGVALTHGNRHNPVPRLRATIANLQKLFVRRRIAHKLPESRRWHPGNLKVGGGGLRRRYSRVNGHYHFVI